MEVYESVTWLCWRLICVASDVTALSRVDALCDSTFSVLAAVAMGSTWRRDLADGQAEDLSLDLTARLYYI